MANTLGIPERTLTQIADAANSINVIGGVDGRLSPYEPLVVRISNHQDNMAAEVGSDTSKMALFESKAHGQPWLKQSNVLETVIHRSPAGAPEAAPANASCIYPSYDYTTF